MPKSRKTGRRAGREEGAAPGRGEGSAPVGGGGPLPPEEPPPPYGWALLSAGLVFLLYAVTLAPTTAFWDTSEYIATAHILGIPHPPGNPLFVVLGRAWDILLEPTGLPVAVRINLLSATVSALAHGLWFLVVHHVLRYFSEDRWFRLAGAFAAVLVSATAFTVWNQSNVNEKVYTISLLTIALLTWLAFHWRENLGRGKDDNLLILMAFILALSVGNHLMAFLAAPAILVFIVLVQPRTLLNWKLYAAVALVTFVGISIHLFLPLRAGLDPVINEADPTCRSLGSALASVLTLGRFELPFLPESCAELSAALGRRQYDKPPLVPRLAPLHAQLANYLQYFDWQWARALDGDNPVFAAARLPFTLLFTGLGAWGAYEHYRKDRPTWWYVAVLFGTVSLALVFYLNFRYGYSLAAPVENRDLHEVRERDYFFIASFSVWGLWAGIGIASLWRRVARRLASGDAGGRSGDGGGGSGDGRGRARPAFWKASPVLAVALLPLALNWSWASRADDYAARDWAHNLLMSVEPYGILFTNGDNDTFPLWYLQEVEGIRRDVTVIVTSYLNTDWYTKQLRELTTPCGEGESWTDDPTRILCQRAYTAENTDAMYTADPAEAAAAGKVPLVLDEPIERPTGPVLPLDDATIEQVAGPQGYARLAEARQLQLGNVVAQLPAETLIFPWHQFALAAINNSIGERPVYFASSGNAARELGLYPYLVRQGLAFKLSNGPPGEGGEGIARIPASSPLLPVTGPWVDLPRTETLAEEVFVHRSGIPDEWDHWPDPSTVGIPNYYAWTYYALAQGRMQHGDSTDLPRFRSRAEAWSYLGR